MNVKGSKTAIIKVTIKPIAASFRPLFFVSPWIQKMEEKKIVNNSIGKMKIISGVIIQGKDRHSPPIATKHKMKPILPVFIFFVSV